MNTWRGSNLFCNGGIWAVDIRRWKSIYPQGTNLVTGAQYRYPILVYNHETELAAIENLVYLVARSDYHIEQEDKAGKGYVDFISYPNDPNGDGFILELKVDKGPEEAVRQIKEREWCEIKKKKSSREKIRRT